MPSGAPLWSVVTFETEVGGVSVALAPLPSIDIIHWGTCVIEDHDVGRKEGYIQK